VFSDAHVAPSAGWLELLAEATRRPGVGAVRPTLTHVSGQSGAGRGLTWTNAALNLPWLGRGGDRPVPMLCGCLMAMPRGAFVGWLVPPIQQPTWSYAPTGSVN
jgi:hypothetical protein